MQWDELDFWGSEAWNKIQANMDKMELEGKILNPSREKLFAALDEVPMDDVKVVWVGQDPYPKHSQCTGIAFSTDNGEVPNTLANIHKELNADLHYDLPNHGNLTRWTAQGVLLWNAIPTCEDGKSMSHYTWPWAELTKEIIEKVNGVVYIFTGAVAREFVQYVGTGNYVIETSHPSPRGSLSSRNPFMGSRIFSRTNGSLVDLGREHIDWHL